MPDPYVRVTLTGKTPNFEIMSDQMKICDIAFTDLADLCVYMIDLLTEKRAAYEIAIGNRLFKLTWHQLHSAVEQMTGSMRFEVMP